MYRSLTLLLLLPLVSGCGVVRDLLELFGNRETGSPELKAFESQKELDDYFSQQITSRSQRFMDIRFMAAPEEQAAGTMEADGAADGSGGAVDTLASPDQQAPEDGAALSDDFSQTTLQEEGVDEADVVKTDGTYLYVINSAWDGSLLRIVRVSPPEQLAELGTVALDGYGREIYLHDGKVVALTETSGGFIVLGGPGIAVDPVPQRDVALASDEAVGSTAGTRVGVAAVEPGSAGETEYERPRTIVTIIDVSVPQSPAILSQTRFDGTQSSSRMIDGVLHLLIANFQEYYYDVVPMLGQPEFDASAVETARFLPRYEHVDGDGVESSGSTLTWRELYHPIDPDGFGVVTLVSLDVDNNADFTAVGVVAEPGLMYSSLGAMYLTDTEFDFFGDTRETTDIYKFAYVDRGSEPVATGTVPGRILNQYSMGEYNGYLRVATTVGPTVGLFGQRSPSHNDVYVLGQSGGRLEVVGSVEGIAPRETIQSARFVRDRGYVVTFEQIDPLFTLDLSDPTDPRVVGELEVPGFSTFIVPMDADHLLTVGQYIPDDGAFFGWGVQLSIFDVSDFAEPRRAANVVLGADGGAFSEALHNPKAFTYFASRDLVALPVSLYDQTSFPVLAAVEPAAFADDGVDEGGGSIVGPSQQPDDAPPDVSVESVEAFAPQGFEGLVVYSVSADEGFTELKRISTRFEAVGYYGSTFTRGVFIGDDVFAVTDHGVHGAPVNDLDGIQYELSFETPIPTGEPQSDGDAVVSSPPVEGG